ncbi:MAG: hypothetical protein ACQEXJ_02225 [Myxococcota bacterium]
MTPLSIGAGVVLPILGGIVLAWSFTATLRAAFGRVVREEEQEEAIADRFVRLQQDVTNEGHSKRVWDEVTTMQEEQESAWQAIEMKAYRFMILASAVAAFVGTRLVLGGLDSSNIAPGQYAYFSFVVLALTAVGFAAGALAVVPLKSNRLDAALVPTEQFCDDEGAFQKHYLTLYILAHAIENFHHAERHKNRAADRVTMARVCFLLAMAALGLAVVLRLYGS